MEKRERRQDWFVYALLQYDGSDVGGPQEIPAASPIPLPTTVYGWLEYAFPPLASALVDDFPRFSTRTLRIQVTQQGLCNGSDFSTTAKWELNNNSWTEDVPQTPYLVDLCKHGEAAMPIYEAALANLGWDPANQMFPARIGEVIDIIWENSNIPTLEYHTHPLHVHGSHV